jgi:hypothetical protein
VENFFKFKIRGSAVELLKFTKKAILKKLGITKFELVVLGVLSGNDYAPNLKGVGIFAIFKKLLHNHRFVGTNYDAKKKFSNILKSFKNVNVENFDNAMRIFNELAETCLTENQRGALMERKNNINERLKILLPPKSKEERELELKIRRPLTELAHLQLGHKMRFSPLGFHSEGNANRFGRYHPRTVKSRTKDKMFISFNRFTLLQEKCDEDVADVEEAAQVKFFDTDDDIDDNLKKKEKKEKKEKKKKISKGNVAASGLRAIDSSFAGERKEKDKPKRKHSEFNLGIKSLDGYQVEVKIVIVLMNY